MIRWSLPRRSVPLALCAALAAAGATLAAGPDIDKVNGSIQLQSGQQGGKLSTVNGSIRLAEEASAADARTVNGGITLAARSSAASLRSVNGGISIGAGARVAGDVTTVNGTLSLEPGAEIGGRLSNVNGRIQIAGARVGGGVGTVSGSVEIGPRSQIDGGLLVERPQGVSFRLTRPEPPRIVIGPDAVVNGTLRFEREVRLFVSDRARIGPVEGAQPVRFSGDRPPS